MKNIVVYHNQQRCEKCGGKALYEVELKNGRASLRCSKHRFAGTGRISLIRYIER